MHILFIYIYIYVSIEEARKEGGLSVCLYVYDAERGTKKGRGNFLGKGGHPNKKEKKRCANFIRQEGEDDDQSNEEISDR
jgi:hypothetical protein